MSSYSGSKRSGTSRSVRSTSRAQKSYREFMGQEMKRIKGEKPTLAQPEVMKMAAGEWKKYKGDAGKSNSSSRSVRAKPQARKPAGSKTARKPASKTARKPASKTARKPASKTVKSKSRSVASRSSTRAKSSTGSKTKKSTGSKTRTGSKTKSRTSGSKTSRPKSRSSRSH